MADNYDPEILLDLHWLSTEYFKSIPQTRDQDVSSYFGSLQVELKDLKWGPNTYPKEQSQLDISGNVSVAYGVQYLWLSSKINVNVTPQVSAEVTLLRGCILGLDERTVDLPLVELPSDIKERTGERWEFQPGKPVSTFTKPGPTFQREVIGSAFASDVFMFRHLLPRNSTTTNTTVTKWEIKSSSNCYSRNFTAQITLQGNVLSFYRDTKSNRNQIKETPIHTMVETVQTNMNIGFETCFYEIEKLEVSNGFEKSVSFMICGELNISYKDIDIVSRDVML